VLRINFVEGLKVAQRAKVASCLHNVVQRTAGGFQDSLQVLKDLLRLFSDAAGTKLSGGQQRDLPREKKPGACLCSLTIRAQSFWGIVCTDGGFEGVV